MPMLLPRFSRSLRLSQLLPIATFFLPALQFAVAQSDPPIPSGNIRYSSELFRMSTFEEVQQNLTFLNTGPDQTPGLIVMKLDEHGGNYGIYKHIVVLFNATNAPVSFANSQLQGLALHLHPVQQSSNDALTRQSTFNSKTGTATVPALTTAVLVAETE